MEIDEEFTDDEIDGIIFDVSNLDLNETKMIIHLNFSDGSGQVGNN